MAVFNHSTDDEAHMRCLAHALILDMKDVCIRT